MTDQLRPIVDWAQGRYPLPWQRDALRRVVGKSAIQESDHTELAAMIEVAAGLRAADGVPAPQYLELPAAAPAAAAPGQEARATPPARSSVIMGRLHSLKHVNALAPGQQLTFTELGLTLIYGENGAGKTGYSRVLRRACRQWREKDIKPIMSSVQAGAPAGNPEAVFDIREHADAPPRSIRWVQGATPPKELAGFAVFDGSCVRPLIAEENIITYQPQALSILPAFATILAAVEARIRGTITKLREKPASLPTPFPGSPASAYISQMGTGATLAGLDQLIGDHAANDQRLTKILQDLALMSGKDGPESQAQALERLASRFEEVRKQLAQIVVIIGDEALQKASTAESDLKAKRAAAQSASQQQFREGHLPGTGTADEWRVLYQAAKDFCTRSAYPGKAFPVVESGAQCPLCQQELDAQAIERLRRFHAFMEERTATDAEQARKNLESIIKAIRFEIAELPQTIRDEIRAKDPSLGDAIDAVGKELRNRQAALLKSIETGDWSSVPRIETTRAVIPRLEVAVAAIRREAVEKRALVNPTAKAALEAERDRTQELIALYKCRGDIATYFSNLEKARTLEKSLGECGTTALSTQNGKFSELYITKALAQRLNEELRQLGVEEGHLVVEFKTRTERGVTRNSLVLSGTSVNTKDMHEILSEGEQRVLAIAVFLAEIRMAEQPVGAIFDDPVTSLDHRWADRIAERLVLFSADRQVIVFTHHISFSYLIRRHAERLQAVPLHQQFVRRIQRIPGNTGSDPIWEFMPVSERRAKLDALCLQAKQAHATDPDGREYQLLAMELVDLLRSTWECLIEDTLLCGAIRRFEPEIRTGNLDKVEVTTADFKSIFEAMTLLSAYTPAHSRATSHVIRKPSPTELKAEIEKLYLYNKSVRERRKVIQQQREAITESTQPPRIMPSVAPSTA